MRNRTIVCRPFYKRLYERQKRSVLTDKESDVFETEKGTKQGDPLSRSLLNTVLRVALKDDLPSGREKARAYGFEIPSQIAAQT